jgi:hypothetical protein
MVIINLTKKEPAFQDEADRDAKGILEINGFGPDTLPVIEAFAKNNFV